MFNSSNCFCVLASFQYLAVAAKIEKNMKLQHKGFLLSLNADVSRPR